MRRVVEILLCSAILWAACDSDAEPISNAVVDDVYLVENDIGIIEEVLEGPTPTCPPDGPFGTDPGDVAVNVTLTACDGTTRSVHDMCGANAAHINLLAGW